MHDIDDEGHLSVLEIYIINKKKKTVYQRLQDKIGTSFKIKVEW